MGKVKTDYMTPVERTLSKLKIKDLKRECVIRGLAPELVGTLGVPGLESWFVHHFENKIDTNLLNLYDDYVEGVLKANGKLDLVYPELRLGYVGEKDEEGNTIKRKRVPGHAKRKKKNRTKNSDGLFSGTKKALTFELTKQGLSKEEIVKKVAIQFPEAKPKSIGIWYNKAKRKLKSAKESDKG